ncbi:MAG: pyridoxal phosphate-dependent decarboxylase family protein [Planctomycetaceae bacterium]
MTRETPQQLPLDWTGEQLRAALADVVPKLARFLDDLPEAPAWSEPRPRENARRFRKPLPESGTPLDALVESVVRNVPNQGFNTASPGYLAYIPGGGLPSAAVADLIAGVINRYVTVWQAAPAAAELEATVVRWICDMVGYPSASGGFLTTGGSLANWSAVVTARRCRLPDDFLQGTLYASRQTHHSVMKAAMLAGFPEANVRTIDTDPQFRIDCERLQTAIDADRRDGFTPFLIAGNAGTTNTGAVDDLPALAVVAERNRLWLHVDAAYGGFFVLTERGRLALAGLERADSITLDPHKGLFLPFGTGALIVGDRDDLERAHRLDAEYLPAMQQDAERIDFCRISPELSRDFRGLRLWLPIQLHGIDAFRRELDEKLELAEYAASALRAIPQIEIIAEPQLSLLAIRLHPEGIDETEALNALNRRFLKRVNAGTRFMLTGTLLDDAFVLRICVLSFRTHRDRVDECLEAIRANVEPTPD